TLDEGDGGRADEEFVHSLDTGVLRGTLDEGVLRDPVLGLGAESAAQRGQLGHGEAVVLRNDGGRAGAEPVRDLADCRPPAGRRAAAAPSVRGGPRARGATKQKTPQGPRPGGATARRAGANPRPPGGGRPP